MAETFVPSGLTVQQWDAKYFREYLNSNWFKQFMGTGSSNMIQLKEDLTKKPGDSVTFSLVNKLNGTAKDSDEALEGAEEAVDLRSFQVRVRAYDHAVKFKKFEAQKTAIDLRQAHRDVLMDWNMELDRDNIIAAMGSINGVNFASASEAQKDAWLANNADRVLFGKLKSNTESDFDFSDSVVKVDTTDDKVTPDALTLMKRMAKTATPKVRPIRPKGSIKDSDGYIVVMPSECLRDLTANSDFRQANREARARGTDNPIFSGADYVYEKLAIYEMEDIPSLGAVGNGGAIVRPVYLLGAQAIGIAWAKRPETVEEMFDYKRAVGLGITQWYKVEKMRFGAGETDTDNTKDHGVVTGYFASAADA
jgi:N4-gp56 family major capsid protein